MSQVILGLKVMPKDVNIDLNKLEERIRSEIDPERIDREPIAFGLVAMHVVKIVEDAEGELEKIESKLRSIEDVGEVEVTGVSRSL